MQSTNLDALRKTKKPFKTKRIRAGLNRIFSILSVIALVALSFVSVAPNAQAATYNVPADGDLPTVVAGASAGDTITIDAGSYDLSSQLVIDKDLTITGAGMSDTTITTSFDTGTSGDARGLILVEPGVEFHLSDLKIDGTGQKTWQAIRHRGSGTVDSVHFTEIKYFSNGVDGSPYNGNAIAAFGDGAVDVTNSDFDEIGRIGVLYFGTGPSGSVFDSNTYVGKGDGDYLDYALDISAGIDVTVTNNDISNNTGVASSDGSTSAGILVTTFFGAGTTALIENNTLTDNTTAIAVGYDGSDTSTVAAHENSIYGNGEGVASTAPEVDATCNWWGDPSGPSGEGPGTGDSVSEDVLFDPWELVENGDCGFEGLSAAPLVDYNNVGDEHTVTADLGVAVEGVNLAFEVSGVHSESEGVATDTDGVAEFTYTGTAPGLDIITVCVDSNLNEECDDGETSVEVMKYWMDGSVWGGGHILEEASKRKDWKDVSLGGWAGDAGPAGLFGEWQINFHNVDDPDVADKSTFHGSEITDLNFFDPTSATCISAMNLTVAGEFNHEPGWSVVLRAGDSGDPASASTDTLRIELKNPGGVAVYDTSLSGEFSDESSCVGGSRTSLDTGNLTIILPE